MREGGEGRGKRTERGRKETRKGGEAEGKEREKRKKGEEKRRSKARGNKKGGKGGKGEKEQPPLKTGWLSRELTGAPCAVTKQKTALANPK